MDGSTVRIGVVGDSGVGKSSLVHFVCQGASLRQPSWTVGCTTQVLMRQNETFVEFIDVGGHPRYELSRAAFYHQLHGLIFVYDASNKRSYTNLKKWIAELNAAQRVRGDVFADARYQSVQQLPTLIVGNKHDLVTSTMKRSSPMQYFEMEAIDASALQCTLDWSRFNLFLDRAAMAMHQPLPTGDATPRATTRSHATKHAWW
ncbi:hypothetical protein SDRG_10622 [Saprolegnia diclina VS20]|uniref:Rab family, other n=1 Tax=Saprolegnia diclina (strain VS20) TaxID=1156394 RepID=T0Q1W6_SAPDV|nr:hypothetical protein SDRG_10622 [Saprolegnia diclina VS20]EQC31834.1 hypothetical protein SDRG_10622 [Saprolegnia diclina VS20]|eukprot:XP_008614841.1 hypothetical protein SDRG_10622 [Saprolegnia diclina VS20]